MQHDSLLVVVKSVSNRRARISEPLPNARLATLPAPGIS
jgi:hypothetical protein